LVRGGYCPAHAAKQRAERNNDPLKRLYNCARWQATRLVVLARDSVCMACHAWASEVVHHVIDARVWVERGNDFYDESNLIGWCKNCHDAHTARTGGWAGAHE